MAKRKSKKKLTWESSNENYKSLSGGFMPTKEYWSNQREQDRKRKQQEEMKAKSERLTKFFKDSAAHEQNDRGDGTAPNTYAAKLMHDTHFDLNKYLNGLAEKKTEANKKLTQDATYINGGKGEPGLAYQAIMMGADAEKTRENLNKYILKDKERALELSRKGLNRPPRQQDTKEGYDAYEDYLKQPENQHVNKYGIDTYNKNRQNEQDEIDLGRRQTSDLWKMRDEDLEEGKNRYGRRADQYTAKAKKLEEDRENRAGWQPDLSGYGDIYDYVYGWDLKNQDNIINNFNVPANDRQYAIDWKGRLEAGNEEWKADAEKRAGTFYNDTYKNTKYKSKQSAREQFYNQMMANYGLSADETYEDRVAKLSPEERKELDSRIDAAIDAMNNPYENVDYDHEIATANDTANAYLNRQKEYADEQVRRAATREIAGRASGSGEYDPTLIPEPKRMYTEDSRMLYDYEPQGSAMDKAYFWINNPHILEGAENSIDYARKEYFLTDDMKNTFNKLFRADKKNGTNNAQAFMDGIDQYLTNALLEYREYYTRSKANEPLMNIVMGAASVPMNVVQGIMGLAGTISGLFGGVGKDPSSKYYIPTQWTNTVRDETSDQFDDWAVNTFGDWARGKGKFLSNVVYSIADNLFAMGTARGIAGADDLEKTEKLVQLIMSSEATSSTMFEQLSEGKDPTEAVLRAVGDGVIEALTEKYSIEALLKPDVKSMLGDKKAIATFIAKNFVAEGSEEVASDVLNIGLDSILSMAFGHENELKQRYHELVTGGMNEKEASRKVLEEKLTEIGTSFLAGGISGGFMAGGRVSMNALQETIAGKKIRNAETSGTKGRDVLIETGMSMDKATQTYKIAQKMQEDIEKGKEISDYDLGRLAQNIQVDSNDAFGKSAKITIENRAFDLLKDTELGEHSRRRMAQVVSSAVTDGIDTLSKEDRNFLMTSKAGFNAYKSFMTPGETSQEAIGAIMDATKTEREAAASVSELLGGRKKPTVDTGSVGEQMATEEEIQQAEGSRKQGNEVILDGEFGKITGAVTVMEGKRKTLKFTMEGRTEPVAASQIKATDYGTAAIIREAAVNSGFYSAEYVSNLLKAQENGNIKNAGTFLADAMKLRLAAYTGQMMPITGIDRATSIEIYNSSAREHGANRKAQVTGAKAAGKVTIDGAVYGTKAWTDKLADIQDDNARAQIETIAGYFAPHGIEITFKTADQMAEDYERLTGEKEDGTKIYGDEGPKGISINIEGLDYRMGEDGNAEATDSHNMLVTFGHEMTHYLQRHSMQGYNNLERFVFNELKNNGVDVNNRILQVMNRQGLSIEDAMSEIVADSCDQILASESVRDHIKETNQSLFKEIKSFVTNLVDRVKAALGGMKESQSRDSRAMLNSVNRLAKVWLGAYDEAISGKIVEGAIEEANENPTERFSMAAPIEKRTDGMYAVHNMSVKGLMKSIKMGALPGASYAMLPIDQSWTKYGEVSIITDKMTIDPDMKAVSLYMGDAGTPMLGADFNTVEEAEQFLMSQPERGYDRYLDRSFMFLKRIGTLEEARSKLERGKQLTAEQKQQLRAEQEQRGIALERNIFRFMNDRANGRARYDGYAVSKGILLAAEKIERLNLTTFEEKQRTIENEIRTEMTQRGSWSDDYSFTGEDGKQIAQDILDFVDYMNETSWSDMVEAKSHIRTDAGRMAAVILPNTVSEDVLSSLEEFGLDREKIHLYEEGNEEDRTRLMNEIKGNTPGVRFSKAGVDPDTGRSVYISSFAKGTQNDQKRYRIVKLIRKLWSKSPIELTVTENGKQRTILAKYNPEFDYSFKNNNTDAHKLAFANKMGTKASKTVMLNLADDYPEILRESTYDNSKPDAKDPTKTHEADTWHYFIDDIYYADQDSDVMNPYRITINIRELNGEDFVYSYFAEKQADENKKLSVPIIRRGSDGTESGGFAQPSEERIPQEDQKGKTRLSMATLDREYQAAVESGDLTHAEEMLLEKLQRTDGIIAFNAPHGYAGQHKDIARMIKNGTPEVVARAAADMAQYVPDNAVLIPIPPHEGTVTESTDTMILARAIGELTGRPVINALGSDARESRYQAKAENRKGVTAEEMGFRQIAEIPEGTMPIFIDNVVGSGETAKAARNALGGGITLSYAKSTRTQGIEGLKRATVTYDKDGKLIPLSQRFDISKRDVRYSQAELDNEYDQAIKDGDAERQRQLIKYAAEQNGFYTREEAYHGTSGFGFTEFNMEKSQNEIFVAFNPVLAGTYTDYGEVRNIGKKYDNLGLATMDVRELAKELQDFYRNNPQIVGTDDIRNTKGFTRSEFAEFVYDHILEIEELAKGKTFERELTNKLEKEYNLLERGNKDDARQIMKEVWDLTERIDFSNEDEIVNRIRDMNAYMGRALASGEDVVRVTRGTWDYYLSREDVVRQLLNSKNDNEGIYKFYTRPGKQLVVEANDAYWNRIPWNAVIEADQFDDTARNEHPEGSVVNTRTIADFAKRMGYDSVRINRIVDSGGQGNRDIENAGNGDIGIFFNQEDVKSADPVTYDDNGKVIPPSERFNPEKKDIRWSRATHESMDVSTWMMEQTPGSVQTEAERQLLQNYRDLRIRISLSIKRQMDYKAKIKQMESHEADLTPAEAADLAGLREKLAQQQQKQEELETELYKVTASDGYAGMMRHNNIVLNDFILGKTQDEVRRTVDEMVKEAQKAKEEIAKQTAELNKLAESQAVKAMKSYMSKTSLKFAAKSLKKTLNSAMGNSEIENRLAEMALKKASGESIAEDARALAYDMTNQMRGYQNDVMERMRGITITIGPDQQKEMKGNGMTLSSVREQLKGTGVKVKYGSFSSLETDTGEGGDLRTILPELPADIGENSGDALFRFISWAQSMRDTDLEMKQSLVDLDDAALNVMALASTVTTEITNDPAAKKQIDRLMKQIGELTGKTEDIAKQMGAVMDQMDNLEFAGTKAVGMASVLQRDVREAIKYYNKISRIAAQEEKNKVRKNIIEQLKSKHTADLIKQQAKYQEMMKNDRKARALAEDNMAIRNRISTIASRVRKRLMEETDLKNIPEEAKPLARQMLEMLVRHDFVGYRHILLANKQMREKTMSALHSWNNRDGKFDINKDLDWLIVGTGENQDTEMMEHAQQDLIDIESGLLEYHMADKQGIISLRDRKNALKKIDKAVTELWSMIDTRAKAEYNGKRMLVEEIALQAQDDMQHSRFKGENTGVYGHAKRAAKAAVFYGNMTPEYFFKMLRNKTLSGLYEEYHRAENKYGILAQKVTDRIAEIADKYGYSQWDQDKTYTFQLERGGTVKLTLGEMMSLYATWQREAMNQAELNGPEQSYHLEVGGFVTEHKEEHKFNGREFYSQKAHRVTSGDITQIENQMTENQKAYLDEMVRYITKEVGELGNEASMRMYGIKKFKEKYYFPMKVWEGALSKKSDAGATGRPDNRIASTSSSKRRKANASNALLIRDFTKVVCEHCETQLRYHTFAPAIEFMQRTLNQQLDVDTGDPEGGTTKRSLRAAFEEIYGAQAAKYLATFQDDINGGVNRSAATMYDKLLSTFKKSAVAGSLSVAAQQPLSYIRAAMMINPKYLVTSVNIGPQLKKISEEMRKYSGVAVIKKIGKFDMNSGRGSVEYIMPEAKKGKFKTGYDWVSEKTTALPELMDTWTWCNMWEAVKKEQAAQNPGMSKTSDEFLNKVAERFNDVMRKTQVYDSVLVKSQNMRNTNAAVKALTSFMAEPTLTLNVLADAIGEVRAGDKGGKAKLAKAGAIYIVSAIMASLVKGLISAGRSPQDKKTWDENVMYRFTSNLINELNPASLIPGYNDLISVLKNGEISDDAYGVIGKLVEASKETVNVFSGNAKNSWEREVEDTIGVFVQLFTNIPLKNIARDTRAMMNYIKKPWADRKNSPAVLKYQFWDQFFNADNMLGVANTIAGKGGREATNEAYYGRIYAADKAGKQQKVNEMMEYLTLARNTKQSTIDTQLRSLAKKDDKLSEQQKLDLQKKYGLKDGTTYITDEYKKGNIDRKTAESMYRKENPKKEDKKVWETFDRIDYTKAGKLEDGEYYSSYLPLYDAIESSNQSEIHSAIDKMLKYGYKKENIKKQLGEKYKAQYVAASVDGRRQLQNKLVKAYKEIGVSAAEAAQIMQDWVLKANKKNGKK